MLAVALKGQCCIIGIPFNDVTKKEKNIKFLSMESKDMLKSFAVSNNGQVAVKLGNYNVNVYDSNLDFIYGIELDPSHSMQMLDWQDEVLLIYRKNSAMMECISVYGLNDAEVYDIPETEENLEIWQDIYEMKVRSNIETEDYTYQMYDGKLIRVDKNNKIEEIIAENSKTTELSWKFSGILLFVSFIAAFIHDEYKRSERSKKKKR